jgi:hypothetical protein
MRKDEFSHLSKKVQIVFKFEENFLPVVAPVINVVQFVFKKFHSERYAILYKYGIPVKPHLTNIYL